MHIFSVVAVALTNLAIGARYVWLIRRGRIRPALAMWVFFTVAVIGSLLTYLADGEYGLLDNALNTADLFLVSSVALAIALWGDSSTRFTRFDFGCLVGVALILAFWAGTRQHVVAHAAIQSILVIAYIPVVRRLWNAEGNTESFTMWVGLAVAPVFSLLSSRGTLAAVYAVRAIISSALLLGLMALAEWRRRRRAHPGSAERGNG